MPTKLEMERTSLANKRAFLRQQNRQYTQTLVEIPPAEWPSSYRNPAPGSHVTHIGAWRSCDFLVQVVHENQSGYLRISVNRSALDENGGWRQDISWDELQHIKNSIGYADRTAVEVYPPVQRTVNVANMRHLFLLPEHPVYAW